MGIEPAAVAAEPPPEPAVVESVAPMVPTGRVWPARQALVVVITLAGAAALELPYDMTLAAQRAAKPLPPSALAIAWFLMVLLLTGTFWLGVRVNRALGRPGPMVGGATTRGSVVRRLATAAGIGLALAVGWLGIIAAIALSPAGGSVSSAARTATPVTGRLAPEVFLPLVVSAGVTEEVWFRLGLLTVLVWVGTRLAHRQVPPRGVVVGGTLLSALAFAALHLPRLVVIDALPPLMIWVALPVVLILGIVLGTIYWRWGLAAAIVTHTMYDLTVFGFGFATQVLRH